ncbi:hypothetical protein B0H10DRAFT_2209429 [Mycena sp. CBHHK59/15]|nr:hypothetical protein B0H10DRAFT_2209429 [Mycena sp. CBHHK59/15]
MVEPYTAVYGSNGTALYGTPATHLPYRQISQNLPIRYGYGSRIYGLPYGRKYGYGEQPYSPHPLTPPAYLSLRPLAFPGTRVRASIPHGALHRSPFIPGPRSLPRMGLVSRGEGVRWDGSKNDTGLEGHGGVDWDRGTWESKPHTPHVDMPWRALRSHLSLVRASYLLHPRAQNLSAPKDVRAGAERTAAARADRHVSDSRPASDVSSSVLCRDRSCVRPSIHSSLYPPSAYLPIPPLPRSPPPCLPASKPNMA